MSSPSPHPVAGAFLVYPDPQLEARYEAAEALRELSEALVGHHAQEQELTEIATWATAMAARLRQGERVERGADYQARRYIDPRPPEGVAVVTFSDRPISGPANPSAVRMVIHREGDEAVGVAVVDRRFESSPTRAHGGITASMFDDVMGYVNVMDGVAAYTYELTVRYVSGMPLGETVTIRARTTEVDWERRRSTVTAEAHTDDGTLVAEGVGRFALIPRERFGIIR